MATRVSTLSSGQPVFVTGAAGFIGSQVAASFAHTGRRVVRLGYGLDASAGPEAGALAGPVDAGMLSRAMDLHGAPALVVHAAGGSSVAASVSDPATDFDRTVGSLSAVLDFLDGFARGARLIFLSSAAVYGSTDSPLISEEAPLRPISPYGRHKRQAEQLICERAGTLDATILRLFSVYGPGNRKQLFWDVANRLRTNPKRLELSGSGEEARDFLYVDDAVDLIRILAEAKSAPIVVNGGSGMSVSVRQAAEALCRSMDVRTEIVFTGSRRAGDPTRMISDPSLARSLGFSPNVPFDTGIQRFADWVRAEIH